MRFVQLFGVYGGVISRKGLGPQIVVRFQDCYGSKREDLFSRCFLAQQMKVFLSDLQTEDT